MKAPYVRYVAAVIAAGGVVSTSACSAFSSPDAQYGGVCVDKRTNMRIDDARCGSNWADDGFYDTGGSYMMWFPRDYNGDVPGVGRPVAAGTRRVPVGKAVATGVPAAGASKASGGMKSLVRGGFGAKAGIAGGGKAASGGS